MCHEINHPHRDREQHWIGERHASFQGGDCDKDTEKRAIRVKRKKIVKLCFTVAKERGYFKGGGVDQHCIMLLRIQVT